MHDVMTFRDDGRRRAWRAATAMIIACCLAATCGPSDDEINKIILNATPLIHAIVKYEADHGGPPQRLRLLVPKYIGEIPSTGVPGRDRYDYWYNSERPKRWALAVKMDGLGFRHMRYDPSREYEIPVTELRGGWVMVNP